MLPFLFAFVAVQMWVSLWALRRIRDTDDFLVAGRRLGPGLAAASIFATWFGAESCVGAAGSVYGRGWSLLEPEPFAYGVCLLLCGLCFAARLWRLRITTLADFLATRFGASTERLAAVLLLPSSLLWAGAQVRAFGHVVAVNSDGVVSVGAGTMIAAAVAIAYTVAGGLLADVYTDVVQCGALVLGLATLGVAVWWNLPPEAAPPVAEVLAAPADPAWPTVLENWAIPVCGSVVAQEVISRALASRSANVARYATIAGGGCYILIGLIPLAIGVVAPRFGVQLDDPEGILPHLSQQLLPAALNVVFAGALIAAILSTVDSCLLVVSSLVTCNLAPRATAATGAARLRLARWSVVAGGLGAYALATSAWNVHDLVEEASGFGSAGVFVLACTGVFGKAGGSLAANLTLAAGLATWVSGRHLAPDAVPYPYLTSLGAAAAAFAVGCGIERLISSGRRRAA